GPLAQPAKDAARKVDSQVWMAGIDWRRFTPSRIAQPGGAPGRQFRPDTSEWSRFGEHQFAKVTPEYGQGGRVSEHRHSIQCRCRTGCDIAAIRLDQAR